MEQFGSISQATHTTIAVEIGAQSDVVDTHHLDGMVEMGHDVVDGSLAVEAQKAVIEGDLHDTALSREVAHLLVGEVAGMVAEGTTTAMTADDGLLTDFEGIVETFLGSMAEIDHDAQAIHFVDHLTPEETDAVMRLGALGRITDIVVAIMAKRHIDDATLCEVTQIDDAALDGCPVLDAQHDALTTSLLVGEEFVGGASDADILLVGCHDRLNLIEDAICHRLHARLGGLWNVSHHNGSVLAALGHLMQIDEQTFVARSEIDTLWEEHGGVAMRIEGEHLLVHETRLAIAHRLADEPLEEGEPLSQALRMPLHTDNGFELGALHRLDDAIGRGGCDAEAVARLAYCLMME